MSLKNPANEAFIKMYKDWAVKQKLPNAATAVTNDPMEATFIGIHMWKQAVEAAKSTDVEKVIEAMSGQKFKAPCGFELTMDKTNHHLHRPVFIGEIRADGQFNVVWKTKGPVRAQPWSPFIPGNDKKKEEPETK
jgi:urea transport system substrate-binding protein